MKRLLILALAVMVIGTACQHEEKKIVLDNSLRILVRFNGKYGYCDRGGTTVIPPQFDSASLFSEGLASVRVNGKDGYVDTNGKLVIPLSFDSASIFMNGRAAVKKGSKWGYIDQKGKPVTDFDYLSTFAFTEGLAAVVVEKGNGAQAGFIDDRGKFVIKPQFDDASPVLRGACRRQNR